MYIASGWGLELLEKSPASIDIKCSQNALPEDKVWGVEAAPFVRFEVLAIKDDQSKASLENAQNCSGD